MGRVNPVARDQSPPKIKDLFQKMEAGGAKVLNIYRTLAISPPMISSFLKLGNSLCTQAVLDPHLREMVILRVARLAGSEYEWTQHVAIALETGISQQQIDDIQRWSDSQNFTEMERAVLQYADEVALQVKVTDQTFQQLRRHLNDREIVELTLAIGYWGMVARVLVPLQIELDDQPVGSARDLIGKQARR